MRYWFEFLRLALEPALELTPTSIVVERIKHPYRESQTEDCSILIVGQTSHDNVENEEPDYDDHQGEDQPIPSENTNSQDHVERRIKRGQSDTTFFPVKKPETADEQQNSLDSAPSIR